MFKADPEFSRSVVVFNHGDIERKPVVCSSIVELPNCSKV